MNGRPKIPRVPHIFFKWYCKRYLYEELHGDLEEFFYERAEEQGLFKARLRYIWDVIRCFQPYAWKTPADATNSNIVMLRNYYKTSLRSLMKNPLSSFINIFGLSMAIGICLIPYAFVTQDIQIDQFHKNKETVFLATFYADRDGVEEHYGQSPTPLAKMLETDFANVRKVCRIEDRSVVLKASDNVFHENIRYVDPTFLELLSFPLKWGTETSLNDFNSIILSEKMSVKYFGKRNPVGEDVLVIFDENKSKTFQVSGVAEEFPNAHAIGFDFLINFENFAVTDPLYDLNDWKGFVDATFIQIENSNDINEIEAGADKYRLLQNETEEDRAINAIEFVQLAELHNRSRDIRNDISFGSREEGWVILSMMAIFILLLACFNYVNIAIVSASKRLKEIAARKMMGANRKGVVIQFLSENLFLTFLALTLGVLLGSQVFLPWFNMLFSENLELVLMDMNLWVFLIILTLFTGLVAGLYPAFYISRFEIVKIFKGSVQFGKKNTLTKVLLGIQLVLACITISNGVYMTQNHYYQLNRDWGYNQHEVLYLEVSDASGYVKMHESLNQNPNVLSLSGSSHHLGTTIETTVAHLPDRQYDVNRIAVEANYFETMGVELKEGRFLKSNHAADKKAIVVNELLVENMSLDNPIGQTLRIDSFRYEIVGIVKDFHFNDFDYKVLPTIFSVAEEYDYRYISMRVRVGSEEEVYSLLKSEWSLLFPELPFQGGYQEDVFNSYFNYMGSGAKFMRAVGFIGILLASLGLYGLVKLNVTGRIKEFSIRKVLGARLSNLARNVTNQYLLLISLAFVVGSPLSYVFVEAILETFFEYHMPMNYTGIVVALSILIFVLITTISTQVNKVAKANPVDGLKVE